MNILEALKLAYENENTKVRPISWRPDKLNKIKCRYVKWIGPDNWYLFDELEKYTSRQRISLDAPHILFSDEEWEVIK